MNARPQLCLIEDDVIMGESLCDRFELEGFGWDWFKTAAAALDRIGTKSYAAVISDIRLPDFSGEELFRRLSAREVFIPPWIFITAYGSIDRAVALLKLGANDYVTKPFDLDQLIEKLRALSVATCIGDASNPAQPTLGISVAMQRVEALLPRLAAQANTILITGESGVGKEITARKVHQLDPRTAEKPFVAVNCGALTETLLEAELFGYEKGAFTGALRTKRGVFEQADGGTLFLDEIGDMPLVMQVKLLRVLQDHQIVRVGAEQPVRVNLRLVCATHRDLKKLVEQGSFREDLYYRVHVINLKIPPLRERSEDVLWYARMFLDELADTNPARRKRLSPAAEQALIRYPWPGNVRELRHCVERACILSDRSVLEPSTLFEDESLRHIEVFEGSDSLAQYLKACEQTYIRQALTHNHGHLGNTAANLGICRKNLWEKMRKLGLSAKSPAIADDDPTLA